MSDELYHPDYQPGQVANIILARAERQGVPVTPMKLQKLVYISLGWGLALHDTKLFEEPVEAWPHGPVIPSLFHEFKVYSNTPIDGRSYQVSKSGAVTVRFIPRVDRKGRTTVLGTWKTYGRISASGLRRLTHADGTPWKEHYTEGQRGVVIPTSAIRNHFLDRRREIFGESPA